MQYNLNKKDIGKEERKLDFENLKKEELKAISHKLNSMELKKGQYALAHDLYRELFTKYIIDKLELNKYDEELANSNLNFKPVDEEKMDIYQYFSKNELKFFYIRNNIYIDKLNEKEIEFLINETNNNTIEENEKVKQFIECTYKKVIFEDVGKDGKKYITFYGPNSRNYTARNDSLVIGMRYDEFYSNELNDKDWDELHIKQMRYLPEVFNKLILEQRDKVSIPIEVLQYNDFSVKRRTSTSRNKEENIEEER